MHLIENWLGQKKKEMMQKRDKKMWDLLKGQVLVVPLEVSLIVVWLLQCNWKNVNKRFMMHVQNTKNRFIHLIIDVE